MVYINTKHSSVSNFYAINTPYGFYSGCRNGKKLYFKLDPYSGFRFDSVDDAKKIAREDKLKKFTICLIETITAITEIA